MSNNSDYKKTRIDLKNILSQNFLTDINKSVIDNTFNRFLTKDETENVYGLVGEKKLNSIKNNHIIENTPQRTAYQLQPVINKKIATVENIMTYKDILQKMKLIGIDINRLNLFGNTEQFNFVPPINIDKIVNYVDYYWYNPDDINSNPQYISIQNKCNLAQSVVNAKIESLGGQYQYNIIGYNSLNNFIDISGNFVSVFIPGTEFQIINSTNNNNTFTTISSESIGLNTRIFVVETINDTIIDGDVSFDQLMAPLFAEVNLACTISVQKDSWFNDNYWLHASDIPSGGFLIAKRAEMPIIEYLSTIELNEWSYTKYIWNYRKTMSSDWELVIEEPTIEELNTFYLISSVNQGLQTITLDTIHGDLTSIFTPGFKFTTENTALLRTVTGFFEVNSSIFTGTQTVITTIETFNGVNEPVAIAGLNVVPVTTTSFGDQWLGFYNHWLLIGEEETKPNENKITNPSIISEQFLTPDLTIIGLISPDIIEVNNDHTSLFIPGYQFNIVNSTNNNGIYNVVSSLFTGTKTQITIVETINDSIIDGEILSDVIFNLPFPKNEIALYGSDSIRVYINDIRRYLGFNELTNGIYVGGIEFEIGFEALTKIVIEVNAASIDDINRENVNVRTELNESIFTINGPDIVSLIRYRKTEQVKKIGETLYPLFNIYNMDGTFKGISSIWRFLENSNEIIDQNVGFRIVTTNNRRVFYFEQGLIDDNNVIYAYKDSNTISLDNPNGFNTIWRIGINGSEEYIPKYVDSERQPIVIGDINGDWEIPNQLYFNVSHENKKILSSSQLLTHFKSIIDAQPIPTGFIQTKKYWRFITNPNYGLGGTIKEHNNSYDTFISSLFIKNNNTIEVIDFAQDRYERNINLIKNNYENSIVNSFTILENEYITNLEDTITKNLIENFEFNDNNNIIYGDSNTYNKVINDGIKGWIATLPFIRMKFKNLPLILDDDVRGIKEILHHDGHISSYNIDDDLIYNIILKILSKQHPISGLWGIINNIPPPTLMSIYTTFDGNSGKYWLDSNTNILYRFKVISIGLTQPSAIQNSLWFDINSNLLKKKIGNLWVPVNGLIDDITDAWEIIDIEYILGNSLFNIENKLYNAAPVLENLAYDISLLESDPYYNLYLEEYFLNYTKLQNISNPYNVDDYFNQFDAFTWNYKDVNVNIINYPTTLTQTNKPWGSTWWDIYLKIFKTYYPHLEPWKLQGYTDKPLWWDSYYKWTIDNTKKWNLIMWNNIQMGIVPIGELLPNNNISSGNNGEVEQYSHFCVDITNDQLLPPYVSASLDTLINNIGNIPLTINDNYTFGENGPNEWNWRKSSQYLYDILKIGYRLQPIKFFHNVFGEKFYNIGGLQVSKRLNNVYSHTNAKFHGDIIDNETFIVDGINQWYINFNRSKNIDNKLSDFRELWTKWDVNLSYQFNSFIDDKTLQIISRNFEIKNNDYSILIKKSEGFEDYWIDSLNIKNIKYSPKRIIGDHGDDWEFIINIPSPKNRSIFYYGVSLNIKTQFTSLNELTTNELWNHYEIDKNILNQVLTPFTIIGVQNLINFIDGYAEYYKDLGFIFNHSSKIESDPDTGRNINWGLEIERCINSFYSYRNAGLLNKEVEINPFRNNIWFNNKRGIISNIVDGPYSSIKTENTIYDQYGRLIPSKNLQVYREDSLGRIFLTDFIKNDLTNIITNYNYIHIGGLHLFLDSYEHIILFNKYTVDNNLIYDPFFGVNLPRLLLQFNRQSVNTLRPNIGGMFLEKNLVTRNIEKSIDDISLYYDTYIVNENSIFSKESRSLLGFNPNDVEFLDDLLITDKSKLLFWKGMVQNKGSVNSITAFLNSIHFVNATVDEYWAYKLAEFGDNDRRTYPEIKLNVIDIVNDRILFEFNNISTQPNFIKITSIDENRWFELPEQKINFIGDNLIFDSEFTTKIESPTPISGSVFKTDVICDDIRVIFYQGFSKHIENSFSGTILNLSFSYIIDSFNIEVFVNGVKTKDYIESTTTQIIFNTSLLNSTVIVIRRKGNLSNTQINRINSILYEIPNYNILGSFDIYTLNMSKSKLNPCKVIDYKSNVIINDLPIWNPALGYNSPLAEHNIDIKKDIDLAKYNNTFDNINKDLTINYWGDKEVGTIWWDIKNIGYIPYYDKDILNDINERINNWGKLSEWSDINIYEWVSYDKPPSQWELSGTPKKSLYKRIRNYDYFNIKKYQLATTKVPIIYSGFGQINGSDSTELTNSDYSINLILNNLTPQVEIINIVIKGTYSQTFNELIDEIKKDLPEKINLQLLPDGFLFVATDSSVREIDVVADETNTYDLLYSLSKNLSPLYGIRFNIDQHIPTNKFIIEGDFINIFTPLVVFDIYDTNNNVNVGSFTTVSSIFINGGTEITVSTPVGIDSGGVLLVQLGPTQIKTLTFDSYINNVIPTDICVPGLSLIAGNSVFVKNVTVLPNGIVEGQKYYIFNNPNVTGQLLLSNDINGSSFIEVDSDSTIILMNSEWTNSWEKEEEQHADLTNYDLLNVTSINPNIKPCDVVNVYLNGKYKETVIVDDFGILSSLTFSMLNKDLLHVVKPKHIITEEESSFNPDILDDGKFLIQYHEDYEFVSRDIKNNNITNTIYYFWVKNKIEKQNNKLMSISEISKQLKEIPTPYVFFQNILRGKIFNKQNGQSLIVPDHYNQIIVRGLEKRITEDNRYKLRFTQDFSLRDDYNDGKTSLDLKNKHEEWILFREKQQLKILPELWDRMVESLIGFTLESFNTSNPIVVPSLERQLFDDVYNTETRFGLGEGQAFVDKNIAIKTIIAVIENPLFNIEPVDKDLFFNTFYFDTPDNILLTMNYIYNSFKIEDINKIYFEVLFDSFSIKSKYKEIMKTSWIALEGIQLLQTSGTISDDL